MISDGYLRRHIEAHKSNKEIALLDVAQEYILEYLRQHQLFDVLVFKGGTALRKFGFGRDGRFSVDLDFGIQEGDRTWAAIALDTVDGMNFHGVQVALTNRYDTGAQLTINTPHGPITEPAALSIRPQVPWFPVSIRTPQAFDALDRGLRGEFSRQPLPVLDLREIVAEKIAAFRRRRKARDLYDLEHLGRLLQSTFVGGDLAILGALKVYFDVVDEKLGRSPAPLRGLFECDPESVTGANDLGRFHAPQADVAVLLKQCAARYAALNDLDDDIARMVTACNAAERFKALAIRDSIIARLTATVG